MEKEFVPYEEALALKELGFNESCLGYWKSKNWLIQEKTRTDGYTHADQECSAPLYQQAFRFFREKHNLIGGVQYIGGLKPETTWWDIYVIGHFNTDIFEMSMEYQPYEEAELSCLRKLIEIIKTV